MKKTIKALSVSILIFATANAAAADEQNFGIRKNMDIFNSLFRELNTFYVDSIDAEKLVRTAADEMLLTLDPYTNFIPKEDSEDFKYMTTGEYGGIGAIITANRKNEVMISEPYEGKPAHKAGMKAGDVLLEVNGVSAKGKTVSDVSEMLKGQPGETVKVKFMRPGEKSPSVRNIVREKIVVNPVDYHAVYDSIVYIRLSSFTDKAAGEVKKAFLAAKAQQPVEGLVLDLRGNPGGIVDEAVAICNFFLPKGQLIVSTKGKYAQWDNEYKTSREPIDEHIPIVILVDESSASASEIISGAMQDLDRAVIVGNRTYGKGLVQTTRPVGYDCYLKVTTAKYHTPSGRCIQAVNYDENGKAERIPDSLTTEFKTRNGRIVRDGGGIMPDIELEEQGNFSTLVYKLVTEHYIFDFVTEYCRKHDAIAPVDEFALTDADYEDFKDFLKKSDFSYKLKSESMFKDFKKFVDFEGYTNSLSAEIEAIEQKLTPNLDQDLEFFKNQISEFISSEIVQRYYFQAGNARQFLKTDDGLKKAMEVLKDKNLYDKTLSKKR